MQFPKRHNNLNLEQESDSFFRQYLPKDWNITAPEKDYGQDLNIEICENGEFRGLDLIIQLKSSQTNNQLNNTERQILSVATFNYLRDNLRVVMIVKYIQDENEAYWILLKDIEPPADNNQNEFTIYIPRDNKLSEINWPEIVEYVRGVTNKKLAAMRVVPQRPIIKPDDRE